MTSFGYRLNPCYAIKECSSCGALYTRDCSCSKGSVEDKILVPKPLKNCASCAKCGHPVNGPYCQGCALLREKLKEDLITYLKYFHDTSESFDDSTNVVNAPREPFVVKQDHSVKSSQNPPPINECCFECGNALDGIFCQQCFCKSCGKGALTGYNCPPKVLIISNPEPCIQTINNEFPQTLPSFDSVPCIPACCDDDDDYDCAIKPILSTEEPIDSLSMGDEHLDTILATESDEVIKSSVEDLIPIPSELEGIRDTIDDDSLHEENIEYVEASPHDSELVSLEAAKIVIPKVEEIEDDNLRKKLLNVNLLIPNIEALKDNPTPSSELFTKSSSTSLNSFLEETNTFHNSLLEFENFYFDLGEISSGSTTTHSDISLSEYDSFIFDLTHEEFVDELAHIISLPEYKRFYFKDLPDPGKLMSVLNSKIRENLLSTTSVNLPIKDDHSPLLSYVIWIFVAYLTYLVIPPYLHPF
uniref:Pre-mRNA splicing Prp18-interacting factor n=1 Tax=Tanacetum cinerariifolium TaxID=118510 RepID=A0A6L2K5Q7_TANCI|nr:hypothetical protein [Tanacetum cinerariifolium]